MAIITISKGSFSRGEQVAERVAERLGYTSVAREQLLEESCAEYNVPDVRLIRSAYDAPTFWERLGQGKEKYVAYIRAALLKRLLRDDVVYHGLAGQYFVRDIPHVLKVRIIADLEDRIRVVMKRDSVERGEAESILRSDDADRRKWSEHLYGIEVADPSLYDLVLHVKCLTVDNAVEIICHTVGLDRFKTTAESQQKLQDRALAAEVKAAVVDLKPNASVKCTDGRVVISIRAKVVHVDAVAARVKKRALQVAGVKEVEVETEATA